MTRDLFDAQMQWLSRNFNCVSLSTLLAQFENDAIKPRTVCVTFDDGFVNNLTTALPVLKKYRIPMTLFVATGYVGTQRLIWPERIASIVALHAPKAISYSGNTYSLESPGECAKAYRAIVNSLKPLHPNALEQEVAGFAASNGVDADRISASPWFESFRIAEWAELRELVNSELVEIGSHTVNHTIVGRLTREEAVREISESKKMLESNVHSVPYFAYPNGSEIDFSHEHRDIAVSLGYRAVLTSINGTFTARSDPFHMLRVGVGADCSVASLDYELRVGAAFSSKPSLAQFTRGIFTGLVER